VLARDRRGTADSLRREKHTTDNAVEASIEQQADEVLARERDRSGERVHRHPDLSNSCGRFAARIREQEAGIDLQKAASRSTIARPRVCERLRNRQKIRSATDFGLQEKPSACSSRTPQPEAEA